MSQFSASSVAVQKLRLGSVAPKESDLHGAAQALIRLQVVSSWTFASRSILFGTLTSYSRSISLSGCIRAWYRLIGRGKDRQTSNKSKVGHLANDSILVFITWPLTRVFLFSCIIPRLSAQDCLFMGKHCYNGGVLRWYLSDSACLSALCCVVIILVGF